MQRPDTCLLSDRQAPKEVYILGLAQAESIRGGPLNFDMLVMSWCETWLNAEEPRRESVCVWLYEAARNELTQ